MFEDYITEDIIVPFIEKYSNKYDHTPFCGKFMKWTRKMSGQIVSNWEYNVDKKEWAVLDYEKMIEGI